MLAAANAADAATSAGRYELNPILGNGRFGTRALGVKVGISAAEIGVQYLILRRRPEASRKAAYLNFALAGATGALAARNAGKPGHPGALSCARAAKAGKVEK